MVNILYILQQSIYNKDGKWLTADSNINMMVGIVNQLTKYNPDLHFYVLIDSIENFADLNSYDEIMKDPQVHFIPYPFVVDAFLNRQQFDVESFDVIFKHLPHIDIVWSNITEQSRNIKTYLHYKKYDAKLITCCYWLDTPMIGEPKVPEEISYMWRQFDGMECSDLCVFTCESTKKAFFENAKKVFAKSFIKKIESKSTVWDFGFSETEALQYFTNEKFDKKTILFLNRLSDINYTHHEEFIGAVNRLYEKRQDFQVIFTNPSQKADWEGLKKLVKPLYIYNEGMPLTREEYFNLLWKADISFHGFTLERMGGCASVESMFCENVVVMPKIFEYAHRGGQNYPYFCDNNVSSRSIMQKLNLALDNLNTERTRKHVMRTKQFVLKNSSFERVVFNVQNDIKAKLGINIRKSWL